MKKFLFTLAALLMASSAFAKSYLYVNDFEVPASYIGTGEEYEMIVSAHFEECVSAWDTYFTFPEGMTCTGVETGADWAIATYNNRGKAINYAPPLYGAVAPFNHLITASAEAGYNEDKTTYGCIKWWAGEYEEYLIMYFTFDENFKGGKVEIKTDPSCGADNREGFVPANVNADNSAPAPTTVTVEETAQPAPEPTFRVEDGKVYAEAAGHELSEVKLFRVLLDEDGQEMSRVPLGNPFTLPAAIFDEDQVFNFVAYTVANENESANSAEVPYQYTVKKKEDAMPAQPTISFEPEEDGTVTVVAYLMYYGQAPYTEYVDLYLKNAEGEWEKVDNPYPGLPSVNNSYTEDILYEFMAISRADGEQYNKDGYPEYKNYSLPHLEKATVNPPYVGGEPYDPNDWQYEIYIAPNGDGKLNYTVTDAEGNTVTPDETIVYEDGSVALIFDKGNDPVTVHVEAYTSEGATCAESETTKKDIEIPALDKVATPEINYVINGDGTFTVTATCDTEGATIVLYDPEGNVAQNPATVTYDPYVTYDKTWTATATKEHMQPSDTGSKKIVITAGEKADVESPSIMGMKHEGSKKLYDIVITPDPATDGALDYDATPMGTVLRAGATTIQYERGAEPYTVHVEAWTNEGATCKASEKEIKDITVPALDQVAKPTINWAPNGDGTFDIWVSCDTEDAVITLTDGTTTYTVAPGEHKTITYDIYDGYEAIWNATAKATDMLDNTADPKEIIIDEESKVYYTPDPVIGEPVVNVENVTITVTGVGNLSVTYTDGMQTYGPFTGTGEVVITIPRGEDDNFAIINATATATEVPAGYDEVAPGHATSDMIDIPALVYSEAPVIVPTPGKSEWDEDGNQTVDGHVVTVTFEAVQGAEIYYSLDGENFEKWDGEPIEFREDGDYTVYAYAVEPGKMPSAVKDEPIHVDESTSVNGLVNGKTVAGVRYFNMAGQEMQEANGVTIVVTTYTDGTTSAVKVIK